ncbi:hypothetical protein [Streptomyces sp. NBC_01373]|uniref:hypothetical protein n=1 Tax=Streptomyces sp. NBC_01373 TaxID=2903843 RepID=UPI0022528702|nr:hypothetical protein [Streptomyces sp. NBC_01373]MCX4704356.1 hypothetical protein [Streptomyces sp. NBC_01373]MCX4707096.1 hypothetical protein [Streptomyces sp. NBC_01373]
MYLATTTVSILGGSSTDGFGDETDGTTVLASAISASLIESTRTAMEPVTGTPRIIRTHICRLPPGTDIDEDKRIKDEQTNETYIVVAVTRNANPVLAQPLRADLKRTGRAA